MVYHTLATRMGSKGFGELAEFIPRTDTFRAYVKRAMLFFKANSISEYKQLPVFLSSIGGKNYELLHNLVAPELPKDKSLEQAIAVLVGHFNPKPAVVAEHFKFHKREQLPGETIAEYMAELHHLFTYYNFEGYLNEALSDRLVCALQSEST